MGRITVIQQGPAVAGRPPFRPDQLVDGSANGAWPFLFDLLADGEVSHKAADYLNGDAIANPALSGDGSMIVAGGQTVSSRAVTGGAKFDACTAKGNVIAGPNTSLAAIYAGAQHFGVFFYVILPTFAGWSLTGACPFFCTSANANGYTADADMVTILQSNASAAPYLIGRRQRAAFGTFDAPQLAVPDYSNAAVAPNTAGASETPFAQIAFWHDGVNNYLRLRYSVLADALNGITTGTVNAAAVPSGGRNTIGDFSAQKPQWGITNAFWNALATTQAAAGDFTIDRGGIRDLEIDAPATSFSAEMDTDWDVVLPAIADLLAA